MLFKPHFITFHSMYLFNKLYRWTHNYIKQVSCLGTFFSLSTHLLSIHFIFRCEEKCCYARHQDNYSSWRNEKKAFSFHMIHLFFNSTLATPGVSFLFYASVVFWIDCQALECRGRRLDGKVSHTQEIHEYSSAHSFKWVYAFFPVAIWHIISFWEKLGQWYLWEEKKENHRFLE